MDETLRNLASWMIIVRRWILYGSVSSDHSPRSVELRGRCSEGISTTNSYFVIYSAIWHTARQAHAVRICSDSYWCLLALLGQELSHVGETNPLIFDKLYVYLSCCFICNQSSREVKCMNVDAVFFLNTIHWNFIEHLMIACLQIILNKCIRERIHPRKQQGSQKCHEFI